MKITVLVDNTSLIDRYYLAEPAFSLYIEEGNKHILFDTGYSDVVIQNAAAMHIDLNQIDTIVLSHGHNDHTGGLRYLCELKQDIDVIMHPDCFNEKSYEGLDVSAPLKELPANFHLVKTRDAYKISDRLLFMGEIKRTVFAHRWLENDPLYDDSALLYQGEKGIFIMSGCAHSGICNIVEQALSTSGFEHISGILGGFHMQNDPKYNREVADYMKQKDIEMLYPCHCTDLMAKITLSSVCKLKEIGVSTTLEVS